MSPVRILLSASFPRVSLQFRPWQRHLIAAMDSSQTPCKLLPASCVRFLSMSRQRPLGVLSASSQSSLGRLSASSTLFLCSNVLPRLTRRALASSPHIVASPSHASVIACLHHFSRSPCTYPQVSQRAQLFERMFVGIERPVNRET